MQKKFIFMAIAGILFLIKPAQVYANVLEVHCDHRVYNSNITNPETGNFGQEYIKKYSQKTYHWIPIQGTGLMNLYRMFVGSSASSSGSNIKHNSSGVWKGLCHMVCVFSRPKELLDLLMVKTEAAVVLPEVEVCRETDTPNADLEFEVIEKIEDIGISEASIIEWDDLGLTFNKPIAQDHTRAIPNKDAVAEAYPRAIPNTLSWNLAHSLVQAESFDLVEFDVERNLIITGVGVGTLAVLSARQGIKNLAVSSAMKSRGFLPGVALTLLTIPLHGYTLPANHVRERPWIFPEIPIDQQQQILEMYPDVVKSIEKFFEDLKNLNRNYLLERTSNCPLLGMDKSRAEVLRITLCPEGEEEFSFKSKN